MPAQVSESFILRTYPFREADLIVSFFTRDQGKLRGVARRARRPKNSFGAGLERLSHVRMTYYLRENADLGSLNSCELIGSSFALQSDYGVSLALDYITEVSEHILPAHEPNEKFFRLIRSMLDFLNSGGGIWPAVDYFSLWAVRLTGVLPEMRVKPEVVDRVEAMFTTPLSALAASDIGAGWDKATLAPLRRALMRSMEQHVERRFLTAPMLEALSASGSTAAL